VCESQLYIYFEPLFQPFVVLVSYLCVSQWLLLAVFQSFAVSLSFSPSLSVCEFKCLSRIFFIFLFFSLVISLALILKPILLFTWCAEKCKMTKKRQEKTTVHILVLSFRLAQILFERSFSICLCVVRFVVLLRKMECFLKSTGNSVDIHRLCSVCSGYF